MIISMTGFGRGIAEEKHIRISVEISAVNSRYCEVYSKIPRSVSVYESAFQNMIKKALDRGKINASLQMEDLSGDLSVPPLDPGAVRAYMSRFAELKDITGIIEEIRLEHLIRLPEIFSAKETSEEDAQRTWRCIERATQSAIQSLEAMRRTEGQVLREDFQLRRAQIALLLDEVEVRAPARAIEARQRILDRINQVLTDERIDRERLELEVAILVDKMDITEEIVRLRSHFVVFDAAMDAHEPSGRKLNFLVQELNREINTIGSKANDASITQAVIKMKEELEKIREQVQNIV
ncbi:MAG TPA: YicC family protein [Rhodothermales bacterium]|nr:YicC family protein [Rhodothermales bacterium]